MRIQDGNSGRVGCPDLACFNQKRSETSEEDVVEVVAEDDLRERRYLTVMRALEKVHTLVYCPAATCQEPEFQPEDADGSSIGWNRFRQCPRCSFSFCKHCLCTWHGPRGECLPIAQFDHVAMEWADLPVGSVKQKELERTYGSRRLKEMAINFKAERKSAEYLSKVKWCHSCLIYVEKLWGCNNVSLHM
ncbi:hypothetical protein CPB83DRAFT_927029 [Crepidotus variabilis]|uniref:RBR-type E3 ubiquitin transferase n=1 Tax=Crepidotus variabilis TaxID=179855 RepID=A0A9P6EGJ8_9AGAR|nr:hypothetical protein CPB83DRAFT_927029 [Crepidotus variabilis]